MLTKYNLTSEEVIGHIRSHLENNADTYGGFDVRCVATYAKENWHNILCIVRGVRKFPALTDNLSYRDLSLLTEFLPSTSLFEFLDSVKSGHGVISKQQIKFADNPVQTIFPSWEFLPSNNEYDTWPGYVFQSSRPSLSFNLPYGPLISFDQPYFADPSSAIKSWTGTRDFHGTSDARIGALILFLPEHRARFRKLFPQSDLLQIEVEPARSGNSGKLRLKGAWLTPTAAIQISEDLSNPTLMVSIPKGVTGLDLYLLDNEENIFDYHSENRLTSKGQNRVLVSQTEEISDLTELVQKAMKSGETEEVEFKPFIENISKGDTKFEEVIRSVIAFSNTKGGRIFFGINDNCYITGIEKEVFHLSRRLKKTVPETYTLLEGRIRQTINSAVKPLPVFEISESHVDGHTVLIIEVSEGEEKPYSHSDTNDIFIRRGSSNARPNPDSELPQLLQGKLGQKIPSLNRGLFRNHIL